MTRDEYNLFNYFIPHVMNTTYLTTLYLMSVRQWYVLYTKKKKECLVQGRNFVGAGGTDPRTFRSTYRIFFFLGIYVFYPGFIILLGIYVFDLQSEISNFVTGLVIPTFTHIIIF
ncbi:hypothetical protein HanRHA438_Chr05g0212811 [Helianthus annuus]|nr:hypothetical protein HanRHA438_Chr05g0212811 [Helianthus annuus]